MSFTDRIAPARPTLEAARTKRWIYVPYDQLTDRVGPLREADPRTTGVVFVESAEKAGRRPYHKKKLAFVLSNERHFALELAERGFSVLYLRGAAPIASQLRDASARYDLGALTVMRPAERELRAELASSGLSLREVAHEGWLTRGEDFASACPEPPFRMDAFYRQARRTLRVLMTPRGVPVGGRFSFDGDNREPWHGTPPAPPRFRCEPDDITREVIELVKTRFESHWGALDDYDLPASRDDAERAWGFARTYALPHFGPFEDAISVREPVLFHTRLAPLLNVSRVLPRDLVYDAEREFREGRVSLASAEGFIRQVLGWREFVRHVHERTDGFRSLGASVPGAAQGSPAFLSASIPLPKTYWGEHPSGLACLDAVVGEVYRDAYSHHITRLMVLANVATLLGVSARELTDWFWAAYADAFDWVVEPNVLAMGTFATGDVMTTKPYVSGAAYVHRMSDACDDCRFDPTARDPQRACPLPPMYWDFLSRSRAQLATNERMKLPLASEARRTEAQRQHQRAVTERVRAALAQGAVVPVDVASVRPSEGGPATPRQGSLLPELPSATNSGTPTGSPRAVSMTARATVANRKRRP